MVEVEIVGVGHHPSQGLKKGVVINIEATVNSIKTAIQEAELMAGVQIKSVFAGIAGSHIKSLNSTWHCRDQGSRGGAGVMSSVS